MRGLYIIPVSLEHANSFVRQHHRHHPPVIGHKFSIGVISNDGVLVGVAIVGRPVSRVRDDGFTLEVSRVATDGTKNACSALYGAARRATFALGYKRLGTYILGSENGATLRAAGWRCLGKAGGGKWVRSEGLDRNNNHPLETKLLWEAVPDAR